MADANVNLEEIRLLWVDQASRKLSENQEIRRLFSIELNAFIDSLSLALEKDDPAAIDPILEKWSTTRTLSPLIDKLDRLVPLLLQLMVVTVDVCVRALSPDKAGMLLDAIIPVFIYAIEKTLQIERGEHSLAVRQEMKSAQMELERLERSKSNFISLAAHELKTPLTIIEGYASMMKENLKATNQDQPQLQELLAGIANGTNRMGQIVNDMLDISLIDNQLLSLNYQPLWLKHVVKSLQQEFSDIFKRRHLSLSIQSFAGLNEMMYGDPERLYQAFNKLLANSVKYTPDGGSITIGGRDLPGFVEITIADTGVGIPAESQSSIFGPLNPVKDIDFHSSGKTKFLGGGPGLGLPIAKGIIEAHGGTIWVESEGYDEIHLPGTTFHVLIPLRKTPPEDKSAILFEGKL